MDYLDKMFLDNTVRMYLIVFAIIAAMLLFRKLLSHGIASLLYMLIQKKWKSIEKKEFKSLTVRPLSWFLFFVVAIFALDKLNFPSAWDFTIHGVTFNDIAEKTGTTIIIVSFFYFIISFIDFVALLLEQNANAAKDKSHGQVVIFFRDLLKVIVSIIGVLFVIKAAFNQDIGTLLTGLSIVGAALALAAKESLENLIASFIIFFDKPFFTGDTLKVNNVSGTVERIGLRSTRIRTTDKTLVTVPNKQMVDSVVDNLSMRNQRRAEMKLVLSEKSRSEEIQQFITDIQRFLSAKEDEIMKNSVFLTSYNKDGIEITIEYFTQPFTMNEYNKEKQKINFKLMDLMAAHKLDMSSSASSINIINNEGGATSPRQDIL